MSAHEQARRSEAASSELKLHADLATVGRRALTVEADVSQLMAELRDVRHGLEVE
jgi:hypothetical protein